MKAIIKRDGKIVHECTVLRGSEVLAWFINNTNQSMDYALKHNGYSVEYVRSADNEKQ